MASALGWSISIPSSIRESIREAALAQEAQVTALRRVFSSPEALERARGYSEARTARQQQYQEILFEELGIAEEVAAAPASQKWAIVYEAMARHNLAYQDVFPEWQQLCDPVREISWDRVECFRGVAELRLREPESAAAVYATVGIAAFGAAFLLSTLWGRGKK